MKVGGCQCSGRRLLGTLLLGPSAAPTVSKSPLVCGAGYLVSTLPARRTVLPAPSALSLEGLTHPGHPVQFPLQDSRPPVSGLSSGGECLRSVRGVARVLHSSPCRVVLRGVGGLHLLSPVFTGARGGVFLLWAP